MAKTEIILYQWKTLTDGTNPIMLRISKYKQRTMLATGLSCFPKQWDDENGQFIRDKRLTKDYAERNAVLTNIRAKANQINSELNRLGIDFTVKQFADAYLKKAITSNVTGYFENHIQNLYDAGKYGYADVFRSTLKILRIFDKKFDRLFFPDIDLDYIKKFDAFLRVNRSLKDTSISVYMRTFATLLNSAITDGLMQIGAYPFSRSKNDNKYRISKLNKETKKRFIPTEYLKALKEYTFDDFRLETARNLFLFSFYCRGINWIDMAMLTNENIKNEISESGQPIKVIKYTRAKTHKEFEIKVSGEIQFLLNWFNTAPHSPDYLLPIITKPEHTGEALRQHIRDRRSKYNKALNDITKIDKLNFPEALQKISSYYSRHSYAMAMRNTGKNIELISEALGHADLKTTNIYLDSFGRDAVADASENLI